MFATMVIVLPSIHSGGALVVRHLDREAVLDPRRKIRAIGVDIQPAELADAEIFMVLDTSAWQQLGPMGDVLRVSTAKKIVLDHHVSSDDLGAEAFKNTAAEATGGWSKPPATSASN